MAESWEIAGTIGTWVAVGVAVVALIGIVGPVLIWLSSRTRRHKILDSIGYDTNGYLSRGIHLGPNIFLGRRIRAPQLKQIGSTRPSQPELSWDPGSLKDFDTPASWVHLGALLTSYGVNFPQGDTLVMLGDSAYLPVHPSWILAIGLLGRHCRRADDALARGQGPAMFRLASLFPENSRRYPSPPSRRRDRDLSSSGIANIQEAPEFISD